MSHSAAAPQVHDQPSDGDLTPTAQPDYVASPEARARIRARREAMPPELQGLLDELDGLNDR
jgi:hypothetical protein